VAAAYTAALATMPTLPELAANHMIHGVLVATNFFGINAIPIALNEADYARMWIQSATTMSTYQAVSSTALASTPQTDPPPTILKSNAQSPDLNGDNPLNLPQWLRNILEKLGIGNETVAHDPTVDNALDNLIANFLHGFGYDWSPAAGTLNGLTYDSYTNPGVAIFWVARALELFEDFQQFFVYLTQNPVLAFQYLVSLELFDWPLHLEEIGFWALTQPELLVAAVIVSAAPLAPLGAFAGLAGLVAIPPSAVMLAPAPVVAVPNLVPVLGSTPIAAPAAVPTSAPAPAPTPTATTLPSSAPPPAPPAAGAPGFVPPYAVAPPGVGLGSRMSTSASSSAKRKAPEPDTAAAAAAAATRSAARARRRRRAAMRGYADEFMDMNVEVDPDWDGPPSEEPVMSTVASDQGAGNLGFAGTARKETEAVAAGLTTLAGDEFGGGPKMPMVPGTWDPDGARQESEAAPNRQRRDS
jgi:PPE-repeat protein